MSDTSGDSAACAATPRRKERRPAEEEHDEEEGEDVTRWERYAHAPLPLLMGVTTFPPSCATTRALYPPPEKAEEADVDEEDVDEEDTTRRADRDAAVTKSDAGLITETAPTAMKKREEMGDEKKASCVLKVV